MPSNCCYASILNEHGGEGVCSDCLEHCVVACEGENLVIAGVDFSESIAQLNNIIKNLKGE